MDEQEFRATLSREELEKRAFIIPFKVYDYTILERLNKYSVELGKSWDILINAALVRFMDDIDMVQDLRMPITAVIPQCSKTEL